MLLAMIRLGLSAVLVTVLAPGVLGQTPQEHEQHHPGTTPSNTTPADSTALNASPAAMTSAMPSGGMMEMMGSMTTPSAPPLYPSLMAVPDLTPEQRAEFERAANERMIAGSALMSTALERLAGATQSGDGPAMQEAAVQLRNGQAQFESGLATRRALRESRASREIALDWFRRELELPLNSNVRPHGLFGLSWFHYFTMFILSAFVVTTVGMYWRRMQRAEALVARLAGGQDTAVAVVEKTPLPAVAQTLPTPNVPSSKSNSWTGLLRVVHTFQETPTVKTFRMMDLQSGELPFRYQPGQFLTVTAAPDGTPLKRSYTIASTPTQREFCEITLKREDRGAVSRFLHDRINEGDTLQVTAPSGKFTFTGVEASSVVLIAGGVGITPMMSVVRYLTARSWPGDIYLFYAVRDRAEVIYREELEYIQRRHANFHLTIVAEHAESAEWPYATGRITPELLTSSVAELPSRRVHLCGPPAMMDALKALLPGLGVPAAQIRTEVFAGKEPRSIALNTLPAADTKVAVVTFASSRRTAMMPPTKTVLEAAEDVGVDIEYSCRIGTCGVCRTKLLSGTVTMDVEDGLEPGDKANNVILACQAKATGDITIDA